MSNHESWITISVSFLRREDRKAGYVIEGIDGGIWKLRSHTEKYKLHL